MAKQFLRLIFIFGLFNTASAEESKTVTVNSMYDGDSELVNHIYKYPYFYSGKVTTKDNAMFSRPLNYNRMTNEILFINTKGDILAMINPEGFENIVIGKDTFYYSANGFVQKITHFSTVNLLIKELLEFEGTEKKGAYGFYSKANSDVKTTNVYSDNGVKLNDLEIDQNRVYHLKNEYFLSGNNGEILPANKKTFSILFPKYSKELKNYLESNKINFKKGADLDKLFQYLTSLN